MKSNSKPNAMFSHIVSNKMWFNTASMYGNHWCFQEKSTELLSTNLDNENAPLSKQLDFEHIYQTVQLLQKANAVF